MRAKMSPKVLYSLIDGYGSVEFILLVGKRLDD